VTFRSESAFRSDRKGFELDFDDGALQTLRGTVNWLQPSVLQSIWFLNLRCDVAGGYVSKIIYQSEQFRYQLGTSLKMTVRHRSTVYAAERHACALRTHASRIGVNPIVVLLSYNNIIPSAPPTNFL